MVTELPPLAPIANWITKCDERIYQYSQGGYNFPQIIFELYCDSEEDIDDLVADAFVKNITHMDIEGRNLIIWNSLFGERYLEIILDVERKAQFPHGRYQFISPAVIEDQNIIHKIYINKHIWQSINN